MMRTGSAAPRNRSLRAGSRRADALRCQILQETIQAATCHHHVVSAEGRPDFRRIAFGIEEAAPGQHKCAFQQDELDT